MESKRDFYYKDDKVMGPYTVETFKHLHKKGNLDDATLVCEEGGENWVKLQEVVKAALPKDVQKEPSTLQLAGCGFVVLLVVGLIIFGLVLKYIDYKNSPEERHKSAWKLVEKKSSMRVPIDCEVYFSEHIMGCTDLNTMQEIIISGKESADISDWMQEIIDGDLAFIFPRKWYIIDSGDGYWVGLRRESHLILNPSTGKYKINPHTGEYKRTKAQGVRYYIYNKTAEKYFINAE